MCAGIFRASGSRRSRAERTSAHSCTLRILGTATTARFSMERYHRAFATRMVRCVPTGFCLRLESVVVLECLGRRLGVAGCSGDDGVRGGGTSEPVLARPALTLAECAERRGEPIGISGAPSTLGDPGT